jgi:hypothetical protein
MGILIGAAVVVIYLLGIFSTTLLVQQPRFEKVDGGDKICAAVFWPLSVPVLCGVLVADVLFAPEDDGDR